ncbi:hypothetical protein GTA08_BOTSDO03226 [Botryosphaeria dothidea]|uniref:Duf866 domain protein n=1 Tax=Botryosphaeria dothidea TaxID=55169 RepID=A0A8H4IYZ7_9PEZI|nr:hypothetical protein GTA08_BOTSDO03226 [Botryosphaeria dothidea]
MLALTLTAELEGVTDLKPNDTQENPFYYTFKVQCTSCREIHPNWVSVSRFEQNELSGSRGEANFVWKCKNCKVKDCKFHNFSRPSNCSCFQPREHSASITAAPNAYPQQSPPKRQHIIQFDCRGLEFVEFKPDGDWVATGVESGTKFDGIDLTEGDWFDYDEKAGEEVSVKDMKWEIVRA